MTFITDMEKLDDLRCVTFSEISNAVRDLFIEANRVLPENVVSLLQSARENESDPLACSVLSTIIENKNAAVEMNVPICQDTGMAVLFADIGQGVYLDCDFEAAVNDGVSRGYTEGFLRKSIVKDPLFDRSNTLDNTPCVINMRMSSDPCLRSRIRLTAAPKGFGSENMSRIKMMTPSCTADDVADFVFDCVKSAGSNPCPPIFVGVGIGSDFEGVALLAKRALLREDASPDPNYRELEKRILDRINESAIGPQGFGGDTTALGVYIEHAPTHIAGLPVAVNINCHVARHKTVII